MAEKRMFSKTIINSGKFLKMPPSSRALYFHLGLEADDDGVVEVWPVMEMTNASADDFNLLVTKGFIKVLNDDLVSFIPDWRIHNSIRPDRKKDSIYKDLLVSMVPDVKLVESKNRSDVKGNSGRSMDGPAQNQASNPWTVHGRSMDRIGERESSVEENRLGESNNTPLLDEPYQGVLSNVILSEEEYNKIMDAYENPKKLIDHVSLILANAKPKDNHYAFILKIALQDKWPLKRKTDSWKPEDEGDKEYIAMPDYLHATLEKIKKG